GTEIFRIDNTPDVNKAFRGFAKGMTVPLKFTLSGLAQFTASLKLIRIVVVDAQGQVSNEAQVRVRFINSKTGKHGFVIEPVPGSVPFSYGTSPGPAIDLPIVREVRQ